MSNIAGKAYAINLLTPIRDVMLPINKLLLWGASQRRLRGGPSTLALLHFARWLIIRDRDLPQVSPEQPKERLRHSYLLFLGTINCSLQQGVDHFASAFPHALHWLCFGNPGWPRSAATKQLQNIASNQIWTDYFYSSYPLASAHDLRSAQRVKRDLCRFIQRTEDTAPAEFMREYHALLKELQADLGLLAANPIASMAARDLPVHVAVDAPEETDVYRAALQPAAESRPVSERVPARRRAQ